MNTQPTLTELLARAKLVEETPHLLRQLQLKLERAVQQCQREISLSAFKRKSRKRRA